MTDPLRQLTRSVAREQDALLERASPSESTRTLVADRAGRARRAPPSVRPWWRFAPIVAACVVGLVVGATLVRRDDAALSFLVGSELRSGALGGWQRAPSSASLPMRFSDGTTVDLAPGASARVVRTDAHGADIVIDSGRAHVDVVPDRGGRWSVQSGPFLVDVRGTRFDVEWDATADRFDLVLFEGRVVITGCGIDEPQVIEAGRSVQASCLDRTFEIEALPAPAASVASASRSSGHLAASAHDAPIEAPASVSAASPSAGATPGSASPTHDAPASRTASAPTDASARWADLARSGRYREAFESAERAGFEGELARAGAAELVLLGDAARLTGHGRHAHDAYLAARNRFGGTDAAARAAFAMGRTAFQSGDCDGVARWMETYLSEQAAGTLSPAAREMVFECSLRQGTPERIRDAARTYLERSPQGAHAEAARRVLER